MTRRILDTRSVAHATAVAVALVVGPLANAASTVAPAANAATLTVLHAFQPGEGSSPIGRVLVAPDGTLYGVNQSGSKRDSGGTLWKLSPDGVLAVLHVFGRSRQDGSGPMAGVTFGADGMLYGATPSGGAHDHGVVYRVNTDGSGYEIVHAFAAGFEQGSYATTELLLHADGSLYGTTSVGGATTCAANGCGTVYRIGADGSFAQIHAFTSDEGALPSGGLAELPDGRMAGLLGFSGSFNPACTGGCGSLYTITTAGAVALLHLFDGADGRQPLGTPVVGLNGSLYGATRYGGGGGQGVEFQVDTSGSFHVDTTFLCQSGACTPSQGLSPAPGRYTSTDTAGHSGIVNHNGQLIYAGLVATGPLAIGADGALVGGSDSATRRGFVFRLLPQ